MSQPTHEKTMPLRQHLEELRSCLMRGGLCFIVLFIGAFAFKERLIEFILIPWNVARAGIMEGGGVDPGALINIGPAEPVIFTLKLAGAFALLVGAPFYLWQVWGFVGAGLLPAERVALRRSFPFSILLFGVGLAFGYRVLLPLGLQFLLTFVDPELITPQVTVSAYFTLTVGLTLLMGFVFQLPLIMWLVVRAGLVERKTLADSRRMAMLGMLVFSAMMTPPDVVTQMLVTGPMVVLYEVGLLLARKAEASRGSAARA